MLLSIVTRTFNGRPRGLRRLRASLAQQTSQNFEHVLFVDAERRGIGWTHVNLWRVLPQLHGDYVMLVDDDDYLVDELFVESLARQVTQSPEVIIVKMNMGNDRLLPDDTHWGKRPVLGGIAISCPISRRDIFAEHVRDFQDKYEGDFSYIDAVYRCGHPFQWWNRVAARVGEVSHGKAEPEDGHPVAVA